MAGPAVVTEDIIIDISPEPKLRPLNTSRNNDSLWNRRLSSASSTSCSKSQYSLRKQVKRTKYGTICQTRKNPCLVQPKIERVECLDKLVPISQVTPKSPVFVKKPLLSSSLHNRSPVLKFRRKPCAAVTSSPLTPIRQVTPKAKRSLNLNLMKDEPASSYPSSANDIESTSSQELEDIGIMPIPISDSSSQSSSTGAEDTEDEITVATQLPRCRSNLENLNSSMSNMLHIKTPPKSTKSKKDEELPVSARKKQQFIRNGLAERLSRLVEVRQTERRMWRHEFKETSSAETISLAIASVRWQYHLGCYTCHPVRENGHWDPNAYKLILHEKDWEAAKLQEHDVVRVFPPWRSVQVNGGVVILCPDSFIVLKSTDKKLARGEDSDKSHVSKMPKLLFSWNCPCCHQNLDPSQCPAHLKSVGLITEGDFVG